MLGRIKKHVSSNEFLIRLNISFLLVGIFITVLSCYDIPIRGKLNPAQNVRMSIGCVLLVLWFFITPLFDAKKRDKILIELGKFSAFSLLAIFIIAYYSITIKYSSINIIAEIFFTIFCLILTYYIINCLISVFTVLSRFFERILNKMFPNKDNKNKSAVILIIQQISAFLVSLSAFLATTIAVITSIKTIIETLD